MPHGWVVVLGIFNLFALDDNERKLIDKISSAIEEYESAASTE